MAVVSGLFAQRFPVPPWRYRLTTAAQPRMGDFNPRELANTAWALTDSAALHARELLKRSSRGGSWGGWVEVGSRNEGCAP